MNNSPNRKDHTEMIHSLWMMSGALAENGWLAEIVAGEGA